MLASLLKKENILIAVALVCIGIWYYNQQLNKSKTAQEVTKWLPIIGGLAFGFNTLIQIAK